MVFEFWQGLSHGHVAAGKDVFAMVAAHSYSSALSDLPGTGALIFLLQMLLPVTLTAFGIMGLVRSYGRNALCPDPWIITERGELVSDAPPTRDDMLPDRDREITIRLERSRFLLRRDRCVVMVPAPEGMGKDTGREVWPAKGVTYS